MEQKLLIVDDEAHIRMLIEQTLEELEDEDVTFFTAENGEQALEIIQAEKPSLVFLDVMMPKMNGAAILVESMEAFGLDRVETSETDILHGAALFAASTGIG